MNIFQGKFGIRNMDLNLKYLPNFALLNTRFIIKVLISGKSVDDKKLVELLNVKLVGQVAA